MSGHGEAGFVVGVDFGGSKVAVGTARADGAIVHEARFPIDAARGAGPAVQRALGAAREVIARTESETGERCAAAGVVSPGIVLPDRILLAPNVPGWEELALDAVVRDELGLDDVAVANDTNAAGLAEARWGSLVDADPALYVGLGTGVAAAVLVGGRILCGAHGAAGEIAYSLCGSGEGRAFADGRAPLEERAGGRFIGLRASEVAGRALTGADAFAATDPPVRAVVDDALATLAVHVANMAILLDPARIALGGGMMRSAQRILDAVTGRVMRTVPLPPPIVQARFGHDAALHGALALALDAACAAEPALPAGGPR